MVVHSAFLHVISKPFGRRGLVVHSACYTLTWNPLGVVVLSFTRIIDYALCISQLKKKYLDSTDQSVWHCWAPNMWSVVHTIIWDSLRDLGGLTCHLCKLGSRLCHQNWRKYLNKQFLSSFLVHDFDQNVRSRAEKHLPISPLISWYIVEGGGDYIQINKIVCVWGSQWIQIMGKKGPKKMRPATYILYGIDLTVKISSEMFRMEMQ